MFAALQSAISLTDLHRYGQQRSLQILSIGRTARPDGEGRQDIHDLLPDWPQLSLHVMANGDHDHFPRGGSVFMPEEFFAVEAVSYRRLGERYDAIVAQWEDSLNQHAFARCLYDFLRADGVLLLKTQSNAASQSPQKWLQPWFTSIRNLWPDHWYAERVLPTPETLAWIKTSPRSIFRWPLNCSEQAFRKLGRYYEAAVIDYSRVWSKLKSLVEKEPFEPHHVQQLFARGFGRWSSLLEDDMLVATSHCPIPQPNRLQDTLGMSFEKLEMFRTKLKKLSFHLWLGQETDVWTPESERSLATSTRRANVLVNELYYMVQRARLAAAFISGPVALSTIKMQEGDALAGGDKNEPDSGSESFWMQQSLTSSGEMPNSFLVYRKIFDAQFLDEGLLPALSSGVFSIGDSIGDFGASMGAYSLFFNRTGLFEAFAFDGASGIFAATKGHVHHLSLDKPFQLWRKFDWVLCLEVMEHIPPEFEQVALLNLRKHANKGAIISWAQQFTNFMDPLHVNGKDDEDVQVALRNAGFERDVQATELVRKASKLSWIGRTVAVYRTLKQEITGQA